MTSSGEINVGDEVLLCGVNRRVPLKVRVTKVGPKLVFVDRDRVGYRRDNGLRRNDEFHHKWLVTPAQHARSQEENAAMEQLRSLGIELRWGRDRHLRALAPEILAAVRTVLE